VLFFIQVDKTGEKMLSELPIQICHAISCKIQWMVPTVYRKIFEVETEGMQVSEISLR
jgi:hypothetical protein